MTPTAILDFLAAAAEGRNVLSTSPAAVAALASYIQHLEADNAALRTEQEHRDTLYVRALERIVYFEEAFIAARADNAALRSALGRFVVPGHCDDVRRGASRCGGQCRWCEAMGALKGGADGITY